MYKYTKRILDVILAIFILVLSAPLLIFCSLAIILDDGRPVFFRQERVGRGGAVFLLYKFRTMVVDAANLGPYHTATNDPRITRVGLWLRKSSLDELPQLLNVLNGTMSLVGPRPDVSCQRQNYSEQEWLRRHEVLPGITGLAQAAGRSNLGADQRKRLDLEYVERQSLGLDLYILMRTALQLLRGSAN